MSPFETVADFYGCVRRVSCGTGAHLEAGLPTAFRAATLAILRPAVGVRAAAKVTAVETGARGSVISCV